MLILANIDLDVALSSILLQELRPHNFANFYPGARNSTPIMTKFGRHVRIDLGMVPT